MQVLETPQDVKGVAPNDGLGKRPKAARHSKNPYGYNTATHSPSHTRTDGHTYRARALAMLPPDANSRNNRSFSEDRDVPKYRTMLGCFRSCSSATSRSKASSCAHTTIPPRSEAHTHTAKACAATHNASMVAAIYLFLFLLRVRKPQLLHCDLCARLEVQRGVHLAEAALPEQLPALPVRDAVVSADVREAPHCDASDAARNAIQSRRKYNQQAGLRRSDVTQTAAAAVQRTPHLTSRTLAYCGHQRTWMTRGGSCSLP